MAYQRNSSNCSVLEGPTIAAPDWEYRRTVLSATAAAWSPTAITAASSSSSDADQDPQQQQQQQRVAMLAVGCKAGCVQLWKLRLPQYSSSTAAADQISDRISDHPSDLDMEYLGAVRVTNGAYVTSLSWIVLPGAPPAAAAAVGSSTSCALPGSIARCDDGDVLLLAVGELLVFALIC